MAKSLQLFGIITDNDKLTERFSAEEGATFIPKTEYSQLSKEHKNHIIRLNFIQRKKEQL